MFGRRTGPDGARVGDWHEPARGRILPAAPPGEARAGRPARAACASATRQAAAGGHLRKRGSMNEMRGWTRAAERRRDAAWLDAALAAEATRLTVVWRDRTLFDAAAEDARPHWLPAADARRAAEASLVTVFLGEEDGAARFALVLDDAAGEDPAALALPGAWEDLRRHAARLPIRDAAPLLHARGMAHWHARHRFCGVCGGPTHPDEGGHVRRCPACGADHFPRTDPAVIVLVTHGERALLGRQAAWRAGQYAALAGFVEPGESLEEAVAREVREESGVALAAVRYHSSQPWPFPSSLMVGFTAEAASARIAPEERDELEDVRWFTRAEVAAGLAAGTFHLPAPWSIAHRLIDDWRRGGGSDAAP